MNDVKLTIYCPPKNETTDVRVSSQFWVDSKEDIPLVVGHEYAFSFADEGLKIDDSPDVPNAERPNERCKGRFLVLDIRDVTAPELKEYYQLEVLAFATKIEYL